MNGSDYNKNQGWFDFELWDRERKAKQRKRRIAIFGVVALLAFMFSPVLFEELDNEDPPVVTNPQEGSNSFVTDFEKAKEDRFYEKAEEVVEEESSAFVNLTAVPFSNGEIVLYPSGNMVAPLSIQVTGSDGYYIYLDCIDEPSNDMAFMVSPGSTAEVSVPLGNYEVFYACGETWYGPDTKFGASTSYYQCNDTFDFFFDGEYYQGWTLELYLQTYGNMDSDAISQSEFPG